MFSEATRCRFRRVVTALGVAMVLTLGATVAGAQTASGQGASIRVRYRSSDTVYLDAGSGAGLIEGARLEVMRGGEVVAEIEVVYVAEHSASCRIVSENGAIEAEDRVRWADGYGPGDDGGTGGVTADETAGDDPTVGAYETPTLVPPPVRRPKARPKTRVSGAFALEFESFTDDSEYGLDFQRTQARLNMRVRDIGGWPLEFRLRVRLQDNQRAYKLSDRAPENERRDRLYEAAVIYRPPEGRFAFQAGRIGTSPFIAVGYLDGLLGQVRLLKSVAVGGFFGSRPLLADFGFESHGTKYGVYSRFSALEHDGRSDLEIYLAGIHENGKEDVSRQYVAIETRYTPAGRWSFYQRAEVDLNKGWREELAPSSTQLSNFSLTTNARISRYSRFSLSYDRFERYRTEETREIPEDLFDDLARQGLRARVTIGRPSGLSFSIQAGLRDRDDEMDDSVSFGGGVRHNNVAQWGLLLGADILGFTNPLTEGWVGTVRAAKRFRRGHEIRLTLGGKNSQSRQFDELDDLNTQWVRLGGWLELPYRLFANMEFEYTTGDDLEGQRIIVGLGYRL